MKRIMNHHYNVAYLVSFAFEGSTPYSMTCKNESGSNWVFYLYQRMVDESSPTYSLAWIVSPFNLAPQAQITFRWSVTFDFVWSSTGTITPGTVFGASQAIPCDPENNNQTTFSMIDNTPTFAPAAPGGTSGKLTIKEDGSIPNNIFATGIGMSGLGTFAQQALSNTAQTYSTACEYYVAAAIANSIKQGEVLSANVSNTKKFSFPTNEYSLTAVLGADNIWTIK